MKRLLYIAILILSGSTAAGQQLPLYSQYIYNKFLINPAVAGSDGYTSYNITAREQWVGYTGAPRTFSFSGQTRLLKRSYILRETRFRRQVFRPKTDGKVGLGGYIFSDRNGLVYRTGFQASYSYHMWVRPTTQLSMGLAFTGYHFKINEKELNFEDPDEPWLNNELRRGVFIPDATFGVYLLNARYNAGFSVDQLFEASGKMGDDAYEKLKMSRHYYLFGSYNFSLNAYSELQPSFIMMMSEMQLRPLADVGLTYIFDQKFWTGLTFRTSGALVANIGVTYDNIFFGYAFDFTLQEIQRLTYGTHELTLALKFGDSARRYRWLDRY